MIFTFLGYVKKNALISLFSKFTVIKNVIDISLLPKQKLSEDKTKQKK